MNISPVLLLFILVNTSVQTNLRNLFVFIIFMVYSSFESTKIILNDFINAVLLYIIYKFVSRTQYPEITGILGALYLIQKYKKNNTFLDKYVSDYYKVSKLKRDEMIEYGLITLIIGSSMVKRKMMGGGSQSLYAVLFE